MHPRLPTQCHLRKFSFTPPERPQSGQWGAVSPNGKHVAFVAGAAETLWIRDLANEQVRAIPGTEGAKWPFWSPDSAFIGYGAGEELKKISLESTAAISVCKWPSRVFYGGAWSPDGDSIVFSSDGPPKLYEVPARGGAPKLLFEPEESEKGPAAVLPHFLPSEAAARSVLFAKGSPNDTEIILKNLETGERMSLGTGCFPWYSSTGHIVYQTNAQGGWPLGAAFLDPDTAADRRGIPDRAECRKPERCHRWHACIQGYSIRRWTPATDMGGSRGQETRRDRPATGLHGSARSVAGRAACRCPGERQAWPE